eukprot:747261-Hanusia_phi.AAC.8
MPMNSNLSKLGVQGPGSSQRKAAAYQTVFAALLPRLSAYISIRRPAACTLRGKYRSAELKFASIRS